MPHLPHPTAPGRRRGDRALELPPGTGGDGVTTVERTPPGTRSRCGPSRPVNRSGATARSSASPRRRSRPASMSTPTIAAWAISPRTMPSASMPSRRRTSIARDLRGHPPPRRPRRHAQLHRHPDHRELLRACRRHGRGYLQAESVHRRRSAGGFPERRRRGGADPQDRLRHDAGRAADAAAPDARRLCPAREFLRTSSSSGWAARSTRSAG